MPRKRNVGQAAALPRCAAVTGPAASGPTAGWGVTGFFQTTAPLYGTDGATGLAVYTEPGQRAINAAAYRVDVLTIGFPALQTLQPQTLSLAVAADAALTTGARLTFATVTGPTAAYAIHSALAQFYPPEDPFPDTGPPALPYPSLIRRYTPGDDAIRFFMPELELDAPGATPAVLELPAGATMAAAALAALPGPCTAPTGATAGTGATAPSAPPDIAAGHAALADRLLFDVANLAGSDRLTADVQIWAEPESIQTSGATAPTAPGYVTGPPYEATFHLYRRTNQLREFFGACPRWTTRAGPRLHLVDLEQATGTATLAWLTGPTGTTGPLEPLPAAWTITGSVDGLPYDFRDRLVAAITGPSGPLPPGAYVLRLEDDLTIPYRTIPEGPTGQKPTPTGNLPTAARMTYPVELAFVVDPTGPAATVSSPPSASPEPVRSLAVSCNETSPTLLAATTSYRPYTLSRDGTAIPSGYRLRPRAGTGPTTHTLELFATGPGRYALTPTSGPSGVFRDLAGSKNVAPWNPVTWETTATAATPPPAGWLEQFPAPLHTAPSGVALTFSEPVTGVTGAALTVTVDGTPLELVATITGAERHYRISGLDDAWLAGWAVWLELGTTGIATISGARTPAGPIRSAWTRANEPAAMPAVETYQFPADVVGPSHFALWTTASGPIGTSGPTHAGARLFTPTGLAIGLARLDVFTGVGTGDPLTAIACETSGPTAATGASGATGPTGATAPTGPTAATGSTAPTSDAIELQALARLLQPGFPTLNIQCPPGLAAQLATTGTNAPGKPRLPAIDERHAIYAAEPLEFDRLTVTIAAEDYTSAPGYTTNAEFWPTHVLADVWPLRVLNGTYELDRYGPTGGQLPPGAYAYRDDAPPGSLTIAEAASAEAADWVLYHYPINPALGLPYGGAAVGPGPLTQQIVDAFVAAGGLADADGLTLEITREAGAAYTVDWTIAPTSFQAWAEVHREFPAAANQCGQPVGRVGGLRVDLLLRGTYQLDALGQPVDKLWTLRYENTLDGHYEIWGKPVYEPQSEAQTERTYYRARHYAVAALLEPAAADAWLAGEPLVRRFPVNTINLSDGMNFAPAPDLTGFPPADDLEDGETTTGPVATTVTPPHWCTVTIRAEAPA